MFIFEGHVGCCEKSISEQPDAASWNEEFILTVLSAMPFHNV